MSQYTHSTLNLPTTHRALVFASPTSPGTIETVPTPLPTASTVVISPLASTVVAYIKDILTRGNPRGYRYPSPFIPGSGCVARVAAAATDVPTLRPGQLVWVDSVVRAADGGGKIMQGLEGGRTPDAHKLIEGEWRDGVWQEYVRVPAANVHALDEEILLGDPAAGRGGLGYSVEDLAFLGAALIPYGGLRDVGLQPGETVLVAPATGTFGGAAVHVALAMGARVIAMGRSREALEDLQAGTPAASPGRLSVVQMSGSSAETDRTAILAANRGRPVDVFFDISPRTAALAPHIKAGVLALREGGRMSVMGGVAGDVGFPYAWIMYQGLTLRGTFMWTGAQAAEMIQMVEAGVVRLGAGANIRCVGAYPLERWSEAFDAAEQESGPGRFVCLSVRKE